MARKSKKKTDPTPTLPELDAIRHDDARPNIPTEELRDFVAADEAKPPTMLYPRDPSLDPQLVWKGKDEQDRQPLEVDVVPIYIQEVIEPRVVVEALRERKTIQPDNGGLLPGFFADFDALDFDRKVEFYQHDQKWANRMILGNSLQVMTSLAEKEGFKGKVQMIYIDPPYGIKFGSNWQISTRKREVNDGKLPDLTRQPEQIRAFRDTWELGIHSYLYTLRDCLIVARDLLSETGSVFVQIGDENLHLVRCLMDEIFGSDNCCSNISFSKTVGATSELLSGTIDYILWYCKSKETIKYHQLFKEKERGGEGATAYYRVELPDGSRRSLTEKERAGALPLPGSSKVFSVGDLTSSRVRPGRTGYYPIQFDNQTFLPPKREWSTHREGVERLIIARRIERVGKTSLGYVRFLDDFPAVPLTNSWTDTVGQNQFGGDKLSTIRERAKTPAILDNAAPVRPEVTAVASWSAPSS
jgi:adenine-specific DNA-methyltransferase